jgi:hypothetical protein
MRSVALLILSFMLMDSPALAATEVDPAVMKAKIAARGEGQDVRVRLVDNTQVNGLIVSIHEQHFVLKEAGPAEPRAIEYAQIRDVHKVHRSRMAKVGVVAAVTVGVIVIAGLVAYATADYDW